MFPTEFKMQNVKCKIVCYSLFNVLFEFFILNFELKITLTLHHWKQN